MRLITHETNGKLEVAIQVGDNVVSLADAVRRAELDPSTAELTTTRAVLAAGSTTQAQLAAAASELVIAGGPAVMDVSGLRLAPPVPDPEKILCLGLNYREHTEEMELDQPPFPPMFAKFRNALIGSGQPIVLPSLSDEVDFEGELAVVIGERCRDVRAEDALDVIGGYMALNDVSARDLQMESSQWTAGKVLDTFAPCGPALVTSDEVTDPQALAIQTLVNGEIVQSASTAEMIVGIAETVSHVSALMTLEVGDIIATGTPSGVGYSREPQMFLADGDTVQVLIEGLGELCNPVVAGRADAFAGDPAMSRRNA